MNGFIWENEDEPGIGPIEIKDVPSSVPIARLTPSLVEVCQCDECDECECSGGIPVWQCECECKDPDDETLEGYLCFDCDPLM